MEISSFGSMIEHYGENTDFTNNGKCSECGQCCGRFLPVSQKEINQIHRYIEKHNIGIQEHGTALLSGKFVDMTCPFVNLTKHKHKCAIYEVRPLICREYICCNRHMKPSKELLKTDIRVIDFSEEFFGIKTYFEELVETP